MDGKELVKQIEIRLAELGMKKGDFYKLTGITSAAYSNWNTGKSQPSNSTLHKIDTVLGTTFDKSALSDNIYEKIQMLQELRDSERTLLAVTKNMTDDEIRRTTEFIKSLKGGSAVD